MYTLEDLKKYPFFEDAAKSLSSDLDIVNILDSLTGLVSRQYFGAYMKELINKHINFSFVIIDIDNFKLINDNHGHHVGDHVLKEIADRLVKYTKEDGVVGRYGGDEYIIIYLKDSTYDGVYQYIYGMYYNDNVFRSTVNVEDFSQAITASVGAASYPVNAKDFDSLFLCADKALYRGKMKGRNCFIVYLKEKHENIDLNAVEKHVLYQAMFDVSNIVNLETDFKKKIKRAVEFVKDYLRVGIVYLLDNDLNIFGENKSFEYNLKRLVPDNGIFQCNNRGDLDLEIPLLAQTLLKNNILSFVCMKVSAHKKNYGYLIIGDRLTQHIWQDEEISLGVYLSKLISSEMEKNNNK